METVPFTADLSEPASLRGIYLERLRRLQRLRRLHQAELNSHGLRLLDRSVFAAYCDCRAIGVEEEAREILSSPSFDVDALDSNADNAA